MVPLFLDDEDLLQPRRIERWLVWFPIMGWIIGGFLQYCRIGRAERQIDSQLGSRPRFPVEAWIEAGINPSDAERIALIVWKTLGWPNHAFLPADPLHLLLLDSEGLGLVLVIGEIEIDSSRKIPLESLSESMETFGDFVGWLLAGPLSGWVGGQADWLYR
jgi:hypothetical protein